MKIAVIGGGSTYTPELVKGFLELQGQLPLSELALMDIQPQRLEIVGDFCERIVEHAGAPFRITLTDNRREAIRGASYVITQLRVGFIPARREDEYLGKRHGLIGQETTGIGGMAKALRTIPVLLEITADMQALAPGAMLVNFTNPSGLVTEALTRYAPGVPAVGLCNSPITTKMGILAELEKAIGQSIDPARAELDSLGLNHLTWYRGFRVDGEDYWPQILSAYLQSLRSDPHPEWPPELIETLGMLPNSYLQYYYKTSEKLRAQENWPPSRAEQVLAIEAELLRQYADPALVSVPPDIMKRGGAWYSTLATRVINAHYNDLGQVEIVNVRQNGAVSDYPSDWVMELPCRIDRAGIHPLPAQPLPLACFGLVAQVKAYELLTVEAAVHGDRKAAYQALLAHPLGPEVPEIQAVLDDLLHTNRPYLPQFFA
ncbi:MAG TPA: 6-phospho-beta-glucosidase [Anaerolinea thermolimosa]|uniref:6-phospho-beta-glucosidase n=1 Tax=Anaerolinea thermolimosa TaxID=229919 RepID=A0A3D1JFC6_9CHLR|nr:6-phospho-beta-glucosidase [Anaerolinea thermolimosa]GAP05764.1 alpha-galactosidases/6-phospho-beta-glucosidases, family 4 of glycosyl hydrolases [Anaerolinea thermolimosa]HCE17290.1 6-phospho-beta-glucosidase [Anaerolinea thermolimosa]